MRKYEKILGELSHYNVGDIIQRNSIKTLDQSFMTDLSNAGYLVSNKTFYMVVQPIPVGKTWKQIRGEKKGAKELFEINKSFFKTKVGKVEIPPFMGISMFLDGCNKRTFTVEDISEAYGLSGGTVSSYLGYMATAGVVINVGRRRYKVGDGVEVCYSIGDVLRMAENRAVKPKISKSGLLKKAKLAGLIK